jgi:hypothetical protein
MPLEDPACTDGSLFRVSQLAHSQKAHGGVVVQAQYNSMMVRAHANDLSANDNVTSPDVSLKIL